MEKLNSHVIQREVDKRLRNLNQSSHSPGNCSSSELKSKRGRNVEVNVKNKLAWPHKSILGGVSRQRVTYDQLTLTHLVQGFGKNILDESCSKKKDIMVSYLSDLMEDAKDFSRQGAKAAHAVLLCEMERGYLQWEDMDLIDWIRRAHAQKHVVGRVIERSHQIRVGSHGSVKVTKQVFVLKIWTMNPMGSCRSIFVHIA